MATIAERAERDIDYAKRLRSQSFSEITVANAIAHATGVYIDQCPITPHVLYAKFKEAGLIQD